MDVKEFYLKKKQLTKLHKRALGVNSQDITRDTQQLMVEFARIKVHEVLEKVKSMQENSMGTLILTEKDIQEIFPLSNIK